MKSPLDDNEDLPRSPRELLNEEGSTEKSFGLSKYRKIGYKYRVTYGTRT